MFEQTPRRLLNDCQACAPCDRRVGANKRSKTTEEFIKKSKEIYGDRFLYDKSVYFRNYEKLTIICKTHGDF